MRIYGNRDTKYFPMASSSPINHDDLLGSTVAVIGLPVGYYFGINTNMWAIGERFRGIRNIPTGLHYVYNSSPNDEMRQGFFRYFRGQSDILVVQWDHTVESLVYPVDQDESDFTVRRVRGDIQFVTGLAPFNQCVPAESLEAWQSASCFITPDVVAKVQPINGRMFQSTQQASPDLDTAESATIFWSEVPKFQIPPGATARDISGYHMDKTAHLMQFSDAAYPSNGTGIIGELQAAFILFLVGQSYESFVQWKRVLELFLGCTESGIAKHHELFEDFMYALQFQVKQLPIDLFADPTFMGSDDDISGRPQAFIIPLLSRFIECCKDETIQQYQVLRKRVAELERILCEKFGDEWTTFAEGDDDEDGPVVVDTS